MTNFSKVIQDEIGENQVIRSSVARTQQPHVESRACVRIPIGTPFLLKYLSAGGRLSPHVQTVLTSLKFKLIKYIHAMSEFFFAFSRSHH